VPKKLPASQAAPVPDGDDPQRAEIEQRDVDEQGNLVVLAGRDQHRREESAGQRKSCKQFGVLAQRQRGAQHGNHHHAEEGQRGRDQMVILRRCP